MDLTSVERDMLAGRDGPAKQRAMKGLVQLGRAFAAPRMVEIGYAHIHAGMALYLEDVELMEELAAIDARMVVPASVNIANADTVNWRQTGAPESLVRLQRRASSAHAKMGSDCTFTCTPYWAGHWPTWNTHMTSIESTVTIFCNSVLGAKSNRDGFFAVYAGMTGRYPLFGYHLDSNRRGTMLFEIDTPVSGSSDFSCLGFLVGNQVGDGVPVISGFARRPTLDELDALGAGIATSGGATMFIVPGVTPPYGDLPAAFGGHAIPAPVRVLRAAIDAVYARYSDAHEVLDIVHLGCPHASYEEMKHYARLLDGRQQRRGPFRGESLQTKIRIDLTEAFSGCKRELRISRHEACDICQGSGCKPGTSPMKCSTCGGQGQVIQSQGFFKFQTTCPACRGRGTVVKNSCPSCNGQGRLLKEVTREISIPAGIDAGMQMCLRGEGEAGLNGGPRGDLFVDVDVKKHPLFQREGQDLMYRLPITFGQAALGAEIEIPTLKGPESLKIKPGTQPGEVNRLRGLGMPDPRGGNGRTGDLLVEIQVEVPRRLSAEQEELLRKLSELDHKDVMPQSKSFFEKVKQFFSGADETAE